MSTGIQVISVIDDLQVTSVEEVTGAIPRTIRIRAASGLLDAQRVIINDLGIDTFTPVSDTALLVSVPEQIVDVPVAQMQVVVVSGRLTGTRRVRLYLGPTSQPSRVSGLQRLVQNVVKILLTNAGSNRFRPQEGGNLVKLTAFPLTQDGQPRLVTALTQGITATEEQIVAAQAGIRNLPAEERLLSLSLGSVAFNDVTREVEAKIRLVTFVGKSSEIPLVL